MPIPLQLLALNAHYLDYPKYDKMSEPCSSTTKSVYRRCDKGCNRVYQSDNPRPATEKKWLFPLNLRKINDNVKLFLQLFKDFWNSSNGIYDNLSSFGISRMTSPGVASSKAWPIGVFLCRYQPFLVGANSYTQLKHKALRFSNLVFIGFLSRKSSIKGGRVFWLSICEKSASQLLHWQGI